MSETIRIAVGGEERLREAIYEQVQREFVDELAATTEYWARAAVEKRIELEVKWRLNKIASPQSLW